MCLLDTTTASGGNAGLVLENTHTVIFVLYVTFVTKNNNQEVTLLHVHYANGNKGNCTFGLQSVQ